MRPDEQVPMSRPVETTPIGSNVAPPASTPGMSHPMVAKMPLPGGGSNTPPKSRGRGLLIVLVILLLAASGGLGYLWYKEKQAVSTLKTEKQSAVSEADSRVSTVQKKLDETQKELESAKKTETTPVVLTDAEAIKAAALTSLLAVVGNKTETTEFTTPKISTKDKAFATIGFGTKGQTGGATSYLKKVNGGWVVIIQGLQQGKPLPVDVALYGIPSDL